MVEPIWLPAGTVTLKSQATWTGGTATLVWSAWMRETSSSNLRGVSNYMTRDAASDLDEYLPGLQCGG